MNLIVDFFIILYYNVPIIFDNFLTTNKIKILDKIDKIDNFLKIIKVVKKVDISTKHDNRQYSSVGRATDS